MWSFGFLLMIEEKTKSYGATIILSLFSNSLQTKQESLTFSLHFLSSLTLSLVFLFKQAALK
jgi:hypothetical protein